MKQNQNKMPNRYRNSTVVINQSSNYKDLFDDKNISSIKQYTTYDFNKLRDIDKYNISYIFHRVQPFERIENIAYKYYGDVQYWWVVCYTNRIANPMKISLGQSLKIYYPIDSILGLL
jgi:hypothetical protein